MRNIHIYLERRLNKNVSNHILKFLLPKSKYSSFNPKIQSFSTWVRQIYECVEHKILFKQIRYETSFLKNAINNQVKGRKYIVFIHRPSFNNVSIVSKQYLRDSHFSICLLLVKGTVEKTKSKRIKDCVQYGVFAKNRNNALISEQKYLERKLQEEQKAREEEEKMREEINKRREEYRKEVMIYEAKRRKDVEMLIFAVNSAKAHISPDFPNGYLLMNKKICAIYRRVDNVVTITLEQEDNPSKYSWDIPFDQVARFYDN